MRGTRRSRHSLPPPSVPSLLSRPLLHSVPPAPSPPTLRPSCLVPSYRHRRGRPGVEPHNGVGTLQTRFGSVQFSGTKPVVTLTRVPVVILVDPDRGIHSGHGKVKTPTPGVTVGGVVCSRTMGGTGAKIRADRSLSRLTIDDSRSSEPRRGGWDFGPWTYPDPTSVWSLLCLPMVVRLVLDVPASVRVGAGDSE